MFFHLYECSIDSKVRQPIYLQQEFTFTLFNLHLHIHYLHLHLRMHTSYLSLNIA